ncbi:MAG: leucine-rich repeat protein [Lachnospiraceae bacterium]|nr:leucine-rich repeat protein [Lachnospiraceae bacterium]
MYNIRLKKRLFIGIVAMLAWLVVGAPVFAAQYKDDGVMWVYEVISDEGQYTDNVKISTISVDNSNLSSIANLSIPKYIVAGDKAYTVTEIGDGAFSKQMLQNAVNSINSVIIPDSVTIIGSQAFNGCTGLTNVTIRGNSLKTIGASAFYNCTNLSSITLPEGLETIGNYAFLGCKSLNSVIIPDRVTTFGSNVFRGCAGTETGLTTIVVGKNVPELNGTFIGCSNLESVTIKRAETSFSGYTFYGCSGLSSIIIPCNFDKKKFGPDNSYIIVDGDNYTVKSTSTTGTFSYTHTYGDPSYSWSADHSKCTGTRCCTGCETVETETADSTSELIKAPNCTEKGTTRYTAAFTKKGFSTQTADVDNIPTDTITGHDWKAPTYTWKSETGKNGTVIWKCTAQRICKNDRKHIETETVEAVEKVTKEATTTAKGQKTFTATFKNSAFKQQIRTEDIPVKSLPAKDDKPSITLSETSCNMYIKDSKVITATLVKDSIKKVTSSKTAVASVKFKGNRITIKAGSKTGKAKITVTTKTKLTKTITVTVKKPTTTELKLSKPAVTLAYKGKKDTVKVTATPAKSKTGEAIKVKSENKKIATATINSKGVITIKAVKKGTTAVTVTAGKIKQTIAVTVTATKKK